MAARFAHPFNLLWDTNCFYLPHYLTKEMLPKWKFTLLSWLRVFLSINRFLVGLNWQISSIKSFVQKMALLVEALNILLSGIWSLWIVWGPRVNLQGCGSIAVTWGMILTIFSKLQGWRKILHLMFSLYHVDIMPLSLKYFASTSDAIFWCGTLAPLFPVVQPIKDVRVWMEQESGPAAAN